MVDFTDVTNVSYSFADEFVGRLGSEHAVALELTGMLPAVERTVRRAMQRRTDAAVRC